MIYAQNPSKESRPVQSDADGKLLVSDTTSTGTKVDAASALPAGGAGNLGWLSRIWYELSVRLPTSLGIKTAAASLSVAPASDSEFTVVSAAPSSAACNIAINESLSTAIDLADQRAARIAVPADWTAANLTFQVSVDGVTYYNLYDKDGTEYTVVAAASRSMILPLADWLGVRYVKVRSGTSAAPVVQLAARILMIQTVAA